MELASTTSTTFVARLRSHGAELLDEIAQYEDIYGTPALRHGF